MQETSIPINAVSSPSVILELTFRLKIRDVMTRNPVCAGPEDSLRQIQHLMKENAITGVPIVQNRHLLGIISMDDIVSALDYGYINDTAEQRMTTNLIVLEEDMPVSFAISYFERFRFHRFPVLNADKALVGIVTNRDITTHLLFEVNKEIEQLERAAGRAATASAVPNQVQSFTVKKHDMAKAGYASTQVKLLLKKAGVSPQTIRKAAVAAYELEMNIVVHSDGGELICDFSPDRLVITSRDSGPGIADVNLAMQKGWSTADEWTRSLGFGAGMGLPNVKSVSDDFSISSSPEGTIVISTILLGGQGGQG